MFFWEEKVEKFEIFEWENCGETPSLSARPRDPSMFSPSVRSAQFGTAKVLNINPTLRGFLIDI